MARKSNEARYTLSIVPDIPTHDLSVTIRSRAVSLFFLGLAVMLVFCAYIVVGYHVKLFQAHHHMAEMYRLHRNLENLKERSETLEGLNDRLGLLQRNDCALRVYGAMMVPDDEMYLAGIGGHNIVDTERLNRLGSPPIRELEALMIDVVRADRRLYILENSFVDIRESLHSQRDIIDYTPSIVPTTSRRISSGFGYRVNPVTGRRQFHDAVDFPGRIGDEVYAAAEGVVIKATWHEVRGKYIEIRHKYGYRTQYAHLHKIFVKEGDVISKSQIIGQMGNTGRTTGANLHYCVIKNDRKVNPRQYFTLIPRI